MARFAFRLLVDVLEDFFKSFNVRLSLFQMLFESLL